MCGIAGSIGGSFMSEQAVSKVLRGLKHRGPDDDGYSRFSEGWIGNTRLSIIDIEGGHQPIANEDGTIQLVCNGEIYNHGELRRELMERGHHFSTRSDAEVILHLYEEMGNGFLDKLRGMFAFAIWDGKRQRLFAARDYFGQRPFFYSFDGKAFRFSSEIKGLLAMPDSHAELDPVSLDQCLALRFVASPRSMFRGVEKLPPGHTLTFDLGAAPHITAYGDFDFEPKFEFSEDDLLEQLEAELVEALRLNTVSDVPVGAFLSAGIDSGLMTSLLVEKVGCRDLATYTLSVPYRAHDEAPDARLLAARYGTKHHERDAVPSLSAALPMLAHHLDEPADVLALGTDAIAAFASSDVKVVLSGLGGDEIFGAYDRYYGAMHADYYNWVPAHIRERVIGPVVRALPDADWYRGIAHQAKWLDHIAGFSGGDRYARSLEYFHFSEPARSALYGSAMHDCASSFDPYSCIRDTYERAPASHPIDKMIYSDLRVRLPDHAGMITDRVGMAHGLEIRCPFLDHRLAQFAARLPVHMKVRGRKTRYLQRQLSARYLPKKVMARQKQGFASSMSSFLREDIRSLCASLLAGAELAKDGFFDQAAVEQIIQEHENGRSDHGRRLWLLLHCEAWYRIRIKGDSQEDLQTAIAAGQRTVPSLMA